MPSLMEPAIGLVLAGVAVLVVLWLAWRKPSLVLVVALVTLAIRPQLLWGGPPLGYEWGLQQSLLVFALIVNAARYGVRGTVNWPILAFVAVLGLSFFLGEPHPKLTWPFMLESLAILALPFAFTQVVLAPGSRRTFAMVIMLLPLVSVAMGVVLQLVGLREVFSYGAWVGHWYRLEGATGNAAVFAMLAFAGMAVAVHEWTRPGRPWAGPLAIVDLILVILSGTRMAMFASAIYLTAYGGMSEDLRALVLRRHRGKALLGAALVAGTLVLYWSTLMHRTFQGDSTEIAMSGRDRIWEFYYEEFLLSPAFGRGLGAGFVALADWWPLALPTPHNEYLHLLVVGGVVGFLLIAAAIVLWSRQLFRAASPNDRQFLIAMAPALAVYAVTDNVLLYSSALALYVYFAVLMTRPSPVLLPWWVAEAEAWQAEDERNGPVDPDRPIVGPSPIELGEPPPLARLAHQPRPPDRGPPAEP